MQYKIIEIFDSLEGEGLRTGQSATFVRLYGCNLRCGFCDTKYSYDDSRAPTTMTADEIVARVNKVYKRVTLTGGEPLAREGVAELVVALADSGCSVNIETNGAVDITSLVQARASKGYDIMFSIDYKLPCSGMSSHMIEHNFDIVDKRDIVKFVVGSSSDIETMIDIVDKHKLNITTNVYIGAVHEQYSNALLARTILSTPCLSNARLQLQLHKIVGIE